MVNLDLVRGLENKDIGREPQRTVLSQCTGILAPGLHLENTKHSILCVLPAVSAPLLKAHHLVIPAP